MSVYDGAASADGATMAALELDHQDISAAEEAAVEDAAVEEAEAESPQEDRLAKGIVEWLYVIVGAVVVALGLRTFLFQAYWIPSESMDATLLIDDRVLVNKISYDLHQVNRGDIVVFERPDDEPGEIRDLIKRVIGLEGDTVEGRDNAVYINDQLLIEHYLAVDEFTGDFGPVIVPPGHVFVMGDNRDQSYDSRFFGTVDTERIVGRAFVLFWPFTRADAL